MKNPAELIAGVLFGAGALIHLARLLCPFHVSIGSFNVPLWWSAAIFVLAGMLSAWLFRERAK